MARILVSWIATRDDFMASASGTSVDPNGPTAGVHEHFWDYDRHLLLSQRAEARGDPKAVALQGWLTRTFPSHIVEVVYVGLSDVINVGEIRGKVEKVLLRHSADEIDLFVSPGTKAMMTAWYFVHYGLALETRLFQVRKASDTAHKKHPEQLFETIEQSSVPSSLAIRQTDMEGPAAAVDFQITPSIEPVYARARLVAQTDDATCLILGPTGTGKEHLARFIHEQSARRGRPFVPINCSALGAGALLESRLFGYVEGVFTDQKKEGRAGIFEEADGGTLFLDEIGDAAPELQQMLLRVLQEKEVTRVGATDPTPVNVRVIGATHRDLRNRCHEGAFRWDLYYRLSLAELRVPPLQDRGLNETQLLIDFFLESKRKKYRRLSKLRLTDAVRAKLEAYPFPGNVRELENLIESLYIFCGDSVDVQELPPWLSGEMEESFRLDHMERRHIESVYDYFGRNKKQTARALGIANNTLKNKLSKYDLD